MATAVLTNVPTVIDNAEATTNWVGDTFVLEPDIKVQGNNSVSCAQTDSGTNDIYVSGTWDWSSTGAGHQHIRLWYSCSALAYMETDANDGLQIFVTDGATTAYWTVGGTTTYGGGWKQFVVYTGNTPTSGTADDALLDGLTGIGMRLTTHSKPRNVVNTWCDAWTFGDGFTVTGGTSGDEIGWSHIAALDAIEAYGIVSEIDAVYFLAGDINIGSGATTTYFDDSGDVCVFKDLSVNTTLYDITFSGSACNVTIEGGLYGAAGTQYYTFDASDTNLNSFALSGKQFVNGGTMDFYTGSSITGCVFDTCGQIDPSTATFQNNTIKNTTDLVGGLLFPSDDTNISGLVFEGNDNAVEYGSGSDASSPKFDDFTFDDVSGKYDVYNTSGSAVSISKNNGSNPNSYNPGGSVVTFLGASVTTQITVKDVGTGLDVENARVLLWVTDATNFPYNASVTSITGTGTTATVTHTGHGLATNDNVWIQGANQENYVGAYEITVTGVDTYTYTTAETVVTSPATGTITATFCFLNKLTNASGIASDSRVVGSNQPIQARIRKSTSSPYYQQGVITDTVDSVLGYTATVALVEN